MIGTLKSEKFFCGKLDQVVDGCTLSMKENYFDAEGEYSEYYLDKYVRKTASSFDMMWLYDL